MTQNVELDLTAVIKELAQRLADAQVEAAVQRNRAVKLTEKLAECESKVAEK